jgi:hypothetical protein
MARKESPAMTIHDRRRTHPVAAHAYTLPVVREVPVGAGLGAPGGAAQQPLYAADSHAW